MNKLLEASRRKVYEGWDRGALVATLLDRDAELERLRNRTLDDYVRKIIEDAHSAWGDR